MQPRIFCPSCHSLPGDFFEISASLHGSPLAYLQQPQQPSEHLSAGVSPPTWPFYKTCVTVWLSIFVLCVEIPISESCFCRIAASCGRLPSTQLDPQQMHVRAPLLISCSMWDKQVIIDPNLPWLTLILLLLPQTMCHCSSLSLTNQTNMATQSAKWMLAKYFSIKP